ncbi:MAG TPA: amidohydrolase [Actinomycetales bacterium]|nr:amidohydrolase [Actinomycetales bacterium]
MNVYTQRVAKLVSSMTPKLVALRRQIRMNPELSRAEFQTTQLVAQELEAIGLTPRILPNKVGLTCDIGPSVADTGVPLIALRADLDALPLEDLVRGEHRSKVAGVAHACGHDVHIAAVVGAGRVLAKLAEVDALQTGVRLIFQPAEELQPGGAVDVIAAGGLDGVGQIFAVHCEPRLDVGTIGLREGPITSASDKITIKFTGAGGHTSRPHLTNDLVFALGAVITQVPGILSRKIDPRSGTNLTWGMVNSGSAPNVIPAFGELEGTLRCLDIAAWERAGDVLDEAVHAVIAPFGIEAEVRHDRGVPPVVNDRHAVQLQQRALHEVLGEAGEIPVEQSLGGEDFAWYLTRAAGAMARLGTRTPGGRTYDLHQGDFDPDERAIAIGAKFLATTALLASAEHLEQG